MSIGVATQSVIFYILSCSECAKITSRHKAKRQAKKDRHEKEQLEMQQPGLYRHPSPFSTNQYWAEDILLGPGKPKNKKDKCSADNGSRSALNGSANGQTGSSYAGSTAQETDAPSSPTAVTEGSRLSGEGWNLKRYQREDEALWGIDFHGPGQKIMEAITKAGETASRFVESRLSRSGELGVEEKEEPRGTYIPGRNPPVNELHPPIVSTQPTSRDETRWMLQPPPSAKVMEGKERVVRSRADSNGSSRSRRVGEEPLSRQVTGKLVDARLQSGESFPDGPSSSRRTRTPTAPRARVQRQERTRCPSPDSSDSSSDMRARTRRKPAAVTASKSYRPSSDDSMEGPYLHRSATSSVPPRSTEFSRRPSTRSKASSSQLKLDNQNSQRSRSSTLDAIVEPSSPANKLSPNAHSMPAAISTGESKPSGSGTRIEDAAIGVQKPTEVWKENAGNPPVTTT